MIALGRLQKYVNYLKGNWDLNVHYKKSRLRTTQGRILKLTKILFETKVTNFAIIGSRMGSTQKWDLWFSSSEPAPL